MNPLSEETKLVILGLIVAVVVAGSAFTVTKLLAAGADREKAAVEAVTLKAQKEADAQTLTWQQRLDQSENAHAMELANVRAESLGPVSLVVPKYTLVPRVPANPAAPSDDKRTASAGELPCSLVPGSSAEMRDFERARAADVMAADYRLLYDSWPTMPPPK
jgi:hypothetical protein